MAVQMTGRKGRVVQNNDGIQYESRTESDVPLEILNLTEKQRFMDGEKVLLGFLYIFFFIPFWHFAGYEILKDYASFSS